MDKKQEIKIKAPERENIEKTKKKPENNIQIVTPNILEEESQFSEMMKCYTLGWYIYNVVLKQK